MQRKKRLGDDSLGWITDTKGSSQETNDSPEKVISKPKRAAKSVKLDVLKHYVSEEAEGKKVKAEKATPPIPDKSTTIVKGKNVVTPKKEGVKEVKEKAAALLEKEAAMPEKEEIKETEPVEEKAAKIEETSYEKIKFTTGEIIGTVKKEAAKAADIIAKPVSTIKKQNIKKKLNSVFSAFTYPVKAISSVDRKITMSVKKISLPDNSKLIDNNILKPIKDVDDSVSRVVKKFLDSIL